SQRTLEYAFQENLSQTPVHFIKKLRLHSIRRKLLTADSSELTIADTAHKYGIYDMGRFASIYKKNFDELPSQTLLKPSVDSTNPFMTFK
ncbi:MAG: AraC family transcriptional regulator, partial [Methyloprofundus sp.]|nr:AraC family transcriptional regulator [Methyloprofundus sp.]